MSTTTPITTVTLTPNYYDKDCYVPDAIKGTTIRVLPDIHNEGKFVTLSLEVNGEQRALMMRVCAAHASMTIDNLLHGFEMGFALAEEIAADEEYERSQAK